MKTLLRRALTRSCLAACCAAASLYAQASRTTSAGTAVRGDDARRIDDYLTRLSGFGWSGAFHIARHDTVLLHKGYGVANRSTGARIGPRTVFDIGSLAKQFTASAIMLLRERGKLSLDDSISQYLDDVPADKRGITIRQLLSHSSGMDSDMPSNDPDNPFYEDIGKQEALRRAWQLPLIGKPGAQGSYSNVGYVVLAAIVERASGRPYRDFIREELFARAGMRSSGFWGAALPRVADTLLARSYDQDEQTGDLHRRSSTTWFDLGGGEIVSTLDDLVHWASAFLNDRVVSARSRRLMWTPAIRQYGLGWMVDSFPAGRFRVYHGGDNLGFGSQVTVYPNDDVVIVDVANTAADILGTRHIAERVSAEMLFGQDSLYAFGGRAFEMPPRWMPIDAAQRRSLVGTYRVDDGSEVVIAPTLSADGLTIGGRGQAALDVLIPEESARTAARAAANGRAIQVVEGLLHGDTIPLKTWLRPGGPVDRYRNGIVRQVEQQKAAKGALVSVTSLGSVPAGFPIGGTNTTLLLHYERGTSTLHFGWGNGRIMNWGFDAPRSIGITPLRASPEGGLVAWNILYTRAVRVSVERNGTNVTGLTLTAGGRSVHARRVASDA
jgi:CubicO group peptidase (beta-lactamase class C family)